MPQRPFTAELQARGIRTSQVESGPETANGAGDLTEIRDSLNRLEYQLAALSEAVADLQPQTPVVSAAPEAPMAPEASVAPETVEPDPEQIAQTRRELSAMTGRSDGGVDQIEAAEQELAAIVRATETATQTILEAAEEVERVISEVSTSGGSPVIAEQLSEAMEAITRIYQASTFQDITGQRISKVVRTLAFIDGRMNALSSLWGVGSDAGAPDSASRQDSPGDAVDGSSETEGWDESHLLNGPQLENQGISQDEIDKLFD